METAGEPGVPRGNAASQAADAVELVSMPAAGTDGPDSAPGATASTPRRPPPLGALSRAGAFTRKGTDEQQPIQPAVGASGSGDAPGSPRSPNTPGSIFFAGLTLAAEDFPARDEDSDSEWEVDSEDGYREREDVDDVTRRIMRTIVYRRQAASMPRLPSYDVSLDVPASPSMSDDEIRATLSKLPNGLMSRTVPARDGPNGARADTNGSNAQSVTASLLAGKPASYKPKKHSANEQSVKLAGPVVAPNAIVPEEVKIEANKRGRQVKEWNWRDDITHHHVWWIIHSITNIVFNCIYWIPLARVSASTFALVNILVGSLCRDTDLIATLHYISPYCPRFGRYHILRMLHCIGGLHVAANLWCYYWVWVYVLNEIILPQWLWDTVSYPWFITFTAVPLPITMTLIICTAFPAMRRKHHDLFEMNHRYTRFTMFAFIFVHIILRNIYVNNGNWNVANTYLVFTLLALAIYPWTLVRKAPINHIYMSGANHVVITYGRKMPAHGFVRISSDLNEWHSFGIAYVDEAKKEFDLVITRAGDWTSKLLDACAKGPGFAPTYHWVRRRGVGFSYTLYAWNRVLLVGTGGGIAASIGYRKPHYPWCQVWILWIATKHEQVFGPKYWELVKEFGEDHYFAWDSKKMGRPGVVMPVELAKKVQAEAVYIVSNEQYTVELRRACMDAGIPAFGAVWDS